MDKNQLKIAYMGTPQFSAEILAGLLDAGFDIVAVITEPDAEAGRKKIITAPPVKVFAQEKNIPVFQPEKKIGVYEALQKIKPDLAVVTAYGKILTAETIAVPPLGILNFHASLLPKYRGASPVQATIINGDRETGVTIMKIDEGMDTGPILSQVSFSLTEEDTTPTVLEKMVKHGLPLLIKTIEDYVDGKIAPQEQNSGEATTCSMIKKEDGQIYFGNAVEEYAKFRAYQPWPGSFAFWNGKRIKFLEIAPVKSAKSDIAQRQFGQCQTLPEGGVFLDDDGGLCLKFAEGYWAIKRLQLEGEKPLSATDFLNGHKEIIGAILR